VPKESIELSFRVSLPGGAFRWVDAEPAGWAWSSHRIERRDPPWLLQDLSPAADPPSDQERLVDRSSVRLYREFLGLAKHARESRVDFFDAVVGFADRYGFLGDPVPLLRQLPNGDVAGVPVAPQVEPLRLWKKQVESFSELDALAELLRTKDIDALRRRIEWDRGREEVRYAHDGKFRRTRMPIATKRFHPDRYERMQGAQAFDRAWMHLRHELNKRLQSPLLVVVPSDPKRRLVAHPPTLIDALYLQLYRKAANVDWERYCDWCGKPLPPESTVRRRFCEGTQCHNHWHNRERGIKRAQAKAGAHV
jgi:hypothetical protein